METSRHEGKNSTGIRIKVHRPFSHVHNQDTEFPFGSESHYASHKDPEYINNTPQIYACLQNLQIGTYIMFIFFN